MARVGIVTDSTADLRPEQLTELDVVMVPLTVHFGDEHVRDWLDMTPEQFYPKLSAFAGLPTTSQPSPADFTAAYTELAEQGVEEIVSIHLSAALSGTYESAMLAAKTAPVPVRVINSLSVSQGTALVVKAAVEARAAGQDAAGVEARAAFVAQECQLFFLLDTLDYLVKGGRAGKAAGLAASLLNIKPVLRINEDGIIEPFKKVRGRAQAVAALAAHVAEESETRGRLRIALLHGCCPDSAQELEDAITSAGADVEWDSHGEIGAVIGVYTGPGAIGCAYYPIG
jgi:DegV family protein with EDD domain